MAGELNIVEMFKNLSDAQASELAEKVAKVIPTLRDEVLGTTPKENTMTLEDKGREARILQRAAELIDAEDAEETLTEANAPLIEELARLQKHPSAYAARIKELEVQLGWDKNAPRIQWHGSTDAFVK